MVANRGLFSIVGMPRCGTTFLYQNLQSHPSIYCPFRKETNYFSVHFDRGISWYEGMFSGRNADQICADISPSYFLDPRAIERIQAYDPNIKIVLGVRRPSCFALSFYNQVCTHHLRSVPKFSDFATDYPYPISGRTVRMRLEGGWIIEQIKNYRAAFGDDLLIYNFELIRRDPLAVLQAIEAFLGLPSFHGPDNFDRSIVNASGRNYTMLTHLLTREWAIDLIGAMFPRRWIIAMRSEIYRQSGEGVDLRSTMNTDEDIQLSRQIFAEDDLLVKAMFESSDLLLGSGSAFESLRKMSSHSAGEAHDPLVSNVNTRCPN